MPNCTNYRADPSFQLAASAGSSGSFDCTCHATSDLIDAATCGAKDPGGRQIRLFSNEPVPDPKSPGLNLPQVADVAKHNYGVTLEVRIGYRSVPWAEYEHRRKSGLPTLIQVGYGPIADSSHNAGRTFRGNHALAETTHATFDPLADGRYPGCFKHDGQLYPRGLIFKAASQLNIGSGARPRPGTVWAAFAPDVVPPWRFAVHPRPGHSTRAFYRYTVVDGRITKRVRTVTKNFGATCSPPHLNWDPVSRGYKYQCELLDSPHKGLWVSSGWCRELKA